LRPHIYIVFVGDFATNFRLIFRSGSRVATGVYLVTRLCRKIDMSDFNDLRGAVVLSAYARRRGVEVATDASVAT
jgi:hypothetical protein